MPTVDCAHYADGRRCHSGALEIGEAARLSRQDDGGFVWLGLHEPTEAELAHAAAEFGLHPLAVEDAFKAHQRPKIEDYDGAFFVVLRTARYDDAREQVDFGELHLFLGPGYVITVRHGEGSELHSVRERIERDHGELLELGPVTVLWAVLDKVVDDYAPVVAGLEDDIDEVEAALFRGPGNDQTQRIYLLKREVVEFASSVTPLLGPLQALERGLPQVPPEIASYFRDVHDHARRINEAVMAQRELLSSVLQANLAVISLEQNVVVRKISAWAAIIAVPTLIASIYGMNFEDMPELDWAAGYPVALGTMAALGTGLYAFFRKRGWL